MAVTVKALTDTSKGGAQVFDLSGFAAQKQEDDIKKNSKEEKLMASTLEYNPNGMWQNDVSEYQIGMDEYLEFVKTNAEALATPGENLDLWKQKQQYENKLKNYVANSVQHNNQMGQSTQMWQNNERYFNSENTDLLTKEADGNLKWNEFSTNGTLHDPVLDQMNRNLSVPLNKYASSVYEFLAQNNEGVTSQRIKELVSESGESIGAAINILRKDKSITYDDEQVRKFLWEQWDNAKDTNPDTITKYEGDFEKFYESVMNVAPQGYKGYSESASNVPGSTGKPVKGQYGAVPQLGSSQTIIESGRENAMTDKEIKDARGGDGATTRSATYESGLGTVNKVYSEGDDYTKAGSSEGQVVRVDGMGISIKLPISGATNLSTGKPVLKDEASLYKNSEIQEFGNYWWAVKDITIGLIDGDNLTIEEGGALPDLDKLVDQKKITPKERLRIMTREKGWIKPGIGMVMISDPVPQGLFGKAEGAEYTKTVGSSEAGKIYSVMPIAGHEAAIRSSLGTDYAELTAAYNGDALGGILAPIQLDNQYYDFWNTTSALR